jgi:hypothetical protein
VKQNNLPDLPLKPPPHEPAPQHRPTPAPPWVALLTTWLGLLTLIAALIVPFLPGTRSPREELEGLQPYAAADWFILIPMYAAPVVFFLGIVVLWQMRKEPRPLPDAMLAQRLQAWVGMALAMIGVVFLYTFVWLRGPGAV